MNTPTERCVALCRCSWRSRDSTSRRHRLVITIDGKKTIVQPEQDRLIHTWMRRRQVIKATQFIDKTTG